MEIQGIVLPPPNFQNTKRLQHQVLLTLAGEGVTHVGRGTLQLQGTASDRICPRVMHRLPPGNHSSSYPTQRSPLTSAERDGSAHTQPLWHSLYQWKMVNVPHVFIKRLPLWGSKSELCLCLLTWKQRLDMLGTFFFNLQNKMLQQASVSVFF